MTQNFAGTNCQGRSFQGQDLSGADFSYADIRGANFNGANLTGANFSHARGGVQVIWGIVLVLASLLAVIILDFEAANFGIFGLIFTAGKASSIFIALTYAIIVAVFAYGTYRRSLISGLLAAIAVTGIVLGISAFIALVASPGFSQLMSGGLGGFPGMYWLIAPGIFAFRVVALGLILAVAVAVAGNVTSYGAMVLGAIAIPSRAMVAAMSLVAGWIFLEANQEAMLQLFSEVDAIDLETVTAEEMPQYITRLLALAGPGVEAAAWSAAIAFALPACVLGIYMGWRTLAGDEQYALIRSIASIPATVLGTRFRGANLSNANFTKVHLKSTDLTGANLTRTCWFMAQQLNYARLGGTYLENREMRKLVVTGDGSARNFDYQNLRGFHLEAANLANASLMGANLAQANLKGADLSGAILARSGLEQTDLRGTTLTGACIEDWGITQTTRLEDIDCRHVYLKFANREKQERWPSEGEFEEGEFTSSLQSILDSFELYHDYNLDVKAVIRALQSLSAQYQEPLKIVAIEKKEDGIFFKIKTVDKVRGEEIKTEYPSRYRAALKFYQQSDSREALRQYNNLERRVAELIEAVKQPRTTKITKMLNRGILITGGNASRYFLEENLEPQEWSSKLERTVNAMDELTAENRVLALEQIAILARAKENEFDRPTQQKLVKKAIRVFRGILSDLPRTNSSVRECEELLRSATNQFTI